MLKTGGVLYGYVPFLLRVHPDPHDHWRFTNTTLQRLLEDADFDKVRVQAFGGLFQVVFDMMYGVWRLPIIRAIIAYLAISADEILKTITGKHRNEKYVIGYFFEGKDNNASWIRNEIRY